MQYNVLKTSKRVNGQQYLHKASKRDIEQSRQRLLRDDARYRCESLPGELLFENYIKIDNFNLDPEMAATMIRQRFDL